MMKWSVRFLCLFLGLCFALSLPVSALDPFYVGTPAEPSEAYRQSKYYDALVDVQLTGDMAYDIIKVALSQVGYREGNSYGDLHGGNKTGSYDYNEYSYWWDGVANRGWCAAFITWCARQAGIPNYVLKGTLAANPVAFDLTLMPKAQADPKIGDLIFFDWDLDGSSDHVGLVAKVSADKVLVVHGNYAEFCTVTSFSRSQVDLLGYARPAYTSAYFAGELVEFFPTVNCGYLYEDGEYFRELLEVELTGSAPFDIGLVARSQVGYRAGHSSLEYNGTPDSSDIGAYTEYGRWYGTLPYAGDWGTAFMLWCARQAGISSEVIYGSAVPNPNNLKLEFLERDAAYGEGHPKLGDIVFFSWPFTDYNWDNCAIVTDADGSTVTVVIGNIEEGIVEEITYSLYDASIKGYGVPAYAQPAPNKLYFDPADGICAVESVYAYSGDAYGELPEAVRDGYVFAGWYNGEALVTPFDTFEGGNITLTAKWQLPKYTVTFDTLGKCPAPDSVTLEKGSVPGAFPELSLGGHSFEGWFTEAEGGVAADPAAPVNGDAVYYARFTPLCGNVNGDESINILDAAVLTRYLAGWSGYEELVDLTAADTDGNGTVDVRDVAIIERHLAGWGGYENMPIE